MWWFDAHVGMYEKTKGVRGTGSEEARESCMKVACDGLHSSHMYLCFGAPRTLEAAFKSLSPPLEGGVVSPCSERCSLHCKMKFGDPELPCQQQTPIIYR
ncbi:unnamed protein product [Calypogeia fissa]